MNNVARIDEHQRKIDVRGQQAKLLRAEKASLEALQQFSYASAAFVSFVNELGLSVVQPGVREILRRLPKTMEHAAGLSCDLSDYHGITQGIANSIEHKEIIMSGGGGKGDGEPPEQP